MNNLKIENISNANQKFLDAFYKEIKQLDKKLIDIITSKNLKIILANKLSEVVFCEEVDIERYQDYHPENRDITTRGLCSDRINAICIFSDITTPQNVGAILYHEIGHLLDFYDVWGKEHTKNLTGKFSTKKEFVEAYKKDITINWNKIKNDNRFRLKHYIQGSTPNKISPAGLTETYAHCFARMHNKFDDIDILSEYFENTLKTIRTNKQFYIMS